MGSFIRFCEISGVYPIMRDCIVQLHKEYFSTSTDNYDQLQPKYEMRKTLFSTDYLKFDKLSILIANTETKH